MALAASLIGVQAIAGTNSTDDLIETEVDQVVSDGEVDPEVADWFLGLATTEPLDDEIAQIERQLAELEQEIGADGTGGVETPEAKMAEVEDPVITDEEARLITEQAEASGRLVEAWLPYEEEYLAAAEPEKAAIVANFLKNHQDLARAAMEADQNATNGVGK